MLFQEGFLASGSPYSQRLLGFSLMRLRKNQWLSAAFIPGHSGGTAADFDRIPLP